MTGKRHSSSEIPQRKPVPLDCWPKEDRRVWHLATSPVDPFTDRGGERTAFRPITNDRVRKSYGQWLSSLVRMDATILQAFAADRITPSTIKTFVEQQQGIGNLASTIGCRLGDILIMARLFDPTRDWSFIPRMAARLRAIARPTGNKRLSLRASHELLHLGHKLMAAAVLVKPNSRAAVLYRDGLIIATMAHLPLRRSNFVRLTIGRDLVKTTSGWTIELTGDQTKNHQPLSFDWPDDLTTHLQTYLETHRSYLLSRHGRWHKDASRALWVSWDGSPLTEMSLYDIIRKRTKAEFGATMNPHMFRDAAATTLAISDPAHVLSAAPLLGHLNADTTYRYYIMSKSLDAGRKYQRLIAEMRRASKSPRITK